MTSISAQYAQRPSRSFVVNSAPGFGLYLQSDVDAWQTANSSYVKKLGTTYVVKPTVTKTFHLILYDVANPGNALDPTGAPNLSLNQTLKDLGKEIRIGTASETSLLVLRLVQFPGPSTSNGIPDNFDNGGTGYIVVENNATDLSDDEFQVYVSRV
jgi:hypothetical protein